MTSSRLFVPVLLGLSLAVTACGGDDDAPSSDAPVSDEPVAGDQADADDPADQSGSANTTLAEFVPLDPMTPADFDQAALSTAPLSVTDLTVATANPCAVFEPAEIEAAYGVAVTEQALTGGCSWTSSPRGFSVRIDVEPSDELTQWAREELEPGVWCCGVNSLGPRYYDEGRVSVSVAVSLPEAGGVSNLSDQASLDLLQALIPRLS